MAAGDVVPADGLAGAEVEAPADGLAGAVVEAPADGLVGVVVEAPADGLVGVAGVALAPVAVVGLTGLLGWLPEEAPSDRKTGLPVSSFISHPKPLEKKATGTHNRPSILSTVESSLKTLPLIVHESEPCVTIAITFPSLRISAVFVESFHFDVHLILATPSDNMIIRIPPSGNFSILSIAITPLIISHYVIDQFSSTSELAVSTANPHKDSLTFICVRHAHSTAYLPVSLL